MSSSSSSSLSCISNINNGENNVLFKLGLLNKNSPHLGQDRLTLFNVCLIVRLLIVIILLSLFFIQNDVIQTIITLFLLSISCIAFFHLVTKIRPLTQWWNNFFEILLLFISILIGLYCLMKGIQSSRYIAIILMISIISGFSQSEIIKPFNC